MKLPSWGTNDLCRNGQIKFIGQMDGFSWFAITSAVKPLRFGPIAFAQLRRILRSARKKNVVLPNAINFRLAHLGPPCEIWPG